MTAMSEPKRKGRVAVPPGPTSLTVATNIRRIRKMKGLSTYELSGALEALQRPIAPSALAKIERGERRVDVDDLVALAVALGVAPNSLLLPDTTEGSVEITGGGNIHARTAHEWADRERPLRIPAGDDGTALVDFTRHATPRGRREWPATAPPVQDRSSHRS